MGKRSRNKEYDIDGVAKDYPKVCADPFHSRTDTKIREEDRCWRIIQAKLDGEFQGIKGQFRDYEPNNGACAVANIADGYLKVLRDAVDELNEDRDIDYDDVCVKHGEFSLNARIGRLENFRKVADFGLWLEANRIELAKLLHWDAFRPLYEAAEKHEKSWIDETKRMEAERKAQRQREKGQ